jgi:hypothetical protein
MSDPAFTLANSARSSRPKSEAKPVGEAEPAFEAELCAFLWKALGPTVSPNVNSSRTDVLIEETIRGTLSSRAILDVCCGWPLLLHKLILQREEEQTFDGEYCYVACDIIAAQEDFKLHIEDLRGRRGSLGVTIHDVLGDAADPKALASAVRNKFDGPFDLILFSNALHEIRPRAIPDLLFTLVSLLHEAGRLVIIDPDPTWLLDPSRWNGLGKLADLEIDWEAAAVWLHSSTYSEILKGFGCTVTLTDARRSQPFWVLQVARESGFTAGDRKSVV